jgi:pimeloyl-ACP methyl ester carboxylesterase
MVTSITRLAWALLGSSLLACLGIVLIAWQGMRQLIYAHHVSPSQSPDDLGLSAEKISFQNHAGQTLRGWFIPAPNAKGTIVFAHGYAGNCSPDLGYSLLFYRAGYNTLFFDFRGHGASDPSPISIVYFERDDLCCALDFLKSRGIQRVGLVGFSMGGAVALTTAAISPMVIGVISDSTFANIEMATTSRIVQHGIPYWIASKLGWLIVALASIRLRANLFSANPIRWIDKISPRPVLVMHGDRDIDVPVESAHLLFKTAREPKQLWIVPNATHRKIEEVVPEEYQRRLVQFFDEILTTSNYQDTIFHQENT